MGKENMQEELLALSKKLGVPTKKLGDLVWNLKGGEVENSLLVRQLGVAKSALNQIKEGLEKYLNPVSPTTSLNPAGAEAAGEMFPAAYHPEEDMWRFLEEMPLSGQVKTMLEKHSQLRPEPRRDLDQFTATMETTARRAALMDHFADIRGKRILCLGDDDFLSTAIGCQGGAREVQVLDIDNRVLAGIGEAARAEGLEIKTEEYDARTPLPQSHTGKYDVVFTDPPYTPAGVKLFLARAIAALDPANLAGRVYLCYGNSDRAKERFGPVQEIFTRSGMMVRWVFDKFNRYLGAESIGSTSSLYILDVTSQTKPVSGGNDDGPIYTNQ